MGLLKRKEATWWTRSQNDPRWNMSGRCYVEFFTMPEAARMALEAKAKELNEEPPMDLEWSYEKD